MKKRNFRIGMALIIAGIGVSLWQFGYLETFQNDSNSPENSQPSQEEIWNENVENKTPVNATFAGGCFWCIEGAYMGVDGVESAISGYSGGEQSTATYDQVKTGETDHREAVRVQYYPSIISYEELLDIFWRSIDPTDSGGQFSDRGPQYTTAIYPHIEEQYDLAVQSKQNISDSGKFNEPIVTEIENYTTFYRAEDRYQNYSRRNRVRYEAYVRGSGRNGFVKKVWEKSPLG